MKNQILEGVVKRHPDGFGFVIPLDSEEEDVFVSRGDMVGIMTNDKVEVEVSFSPKTNKTFGKILRVLERGTKKVVGKYKKMDDGDGLILDKSSQWGALLKVSFKDSMNAVDGDLVAVQIIQYPVANQDFTGKVVEIIGDAEDPLNDITRIVHLHNIPREFSTGALRDADALPDHVLPEEIAKRKDLRDLPFITIDGATAKDFDDAVYVSNNPMGFHLWVAIADVSHYVKAGSSLDDDAYERGTSTYFPNFVVPMLPEKISNELCSLKPNVDRLAYVCEMQLSFAGVVEKTDVYEAVIHSKARVTYGEAQDVLSDDKPHALPIVTKNIKAAADLAKILMTKRFREGSLEINVGETSVVVDEAGNTVDVVRSERLFAHRLIEELMLIANVSVAKVLTEAEIPAIYRVHETPDMEDIAVLDKFLHNFGSEKRLHTKDLAKRLTKSLQEFEGKPEGIVLNILTLRSMMQAKYSADNIGHFGLGFEFYTHFTSPIRRYPDLIVHRLLKSLRYPAYKAIRPGEDKLRTAGTFLSACEQRSVKAERQVTSIKKARFMKQHEGEVFEGVISSVARFGVFVLLRQFDVDGLVKSENLGNDAFEFDEDNLSLTGKRSGVIYKIGDVIKIQVAQANVEEGQIDFVLEGGALAEPGARPHRKFGKSGGGAAKSEGGGHRDDQKRSAKKARRKERGKDRGREKDKGKKFAKGGKPGEKRSEDPFGKKIGKPMGQPMAARPSGKGSGKFAGKTFDRDRTGGKPVSVSEERKRQGQGSTSEADYSNKFYAKFAGKGAKKDLKAFAPETDDDFEKPKYKKPTRRDEGDGDDPKNKKPDKSRFRFGSTSNRTAKSLFTTRKPGSKK